MVGAKLLALMEQSLILVFKMLQLLCVVQWIRRFTILVLSQLIREDIILLLEMILHLFHLHYQISEFGVLLAQLLQFHGIDITWRRSCHCTSSCHVIHHLLMLHLHLIHKRLQSSRLSIISLHLCFKLSHPCIPRIQSNSVKFFISLLQFTLQLTYSLLQSLHETDLLEQTLILASLCFHNGMRLQQLLHLTLLSLPSLFDLLHLSPQFQILSLQSSNLLLELL
mmetsp:Transcript_9113/g.33640  ORF Transcript_9113/g.33640 Transcript_9113/m.33640 type:complete len:224 (-) Transcript_9113:301-972(-)